MTGAQQRKMPLRAVGPERAGSPTSVADGEPSSDDGECLYTTSGFEGAEELDRSV